MSKAWVNFIKYTIFILIAVYLGFIFFNSSVIEEVGLIHVVTAVGSLLSIFAILKKSGFTGEMFAPTGNPHIDEPNKLASRLIKACFIVIGICLLLVLVVIVF